MLFGLHWPTVFLVAQTVVAELTLYIEPTVNSTASNGGTFEIRGSVFSDNSAAPRESFEILPSMIPPFIGVKKVAYARPDSPNEGTKFSVDLEILDTREARQAGAIARQKPLTVTLDLFDNKMKANVSSTDVIVPPNVLLDEIVILTLNDWNGNLELSSEDSRIRGAGSMSIRKNWERNQMSDTIFVVAGDSYGGSPVTSGRLRDQPTIDVLHEWEPDIHALGNNDFVHGVDFIRENIDNGQLRSVVNANLVYTNETRRLVFEPYKIVQIERGPRVYNICFIAVVTSKFDSLVRAGNRQNIRAIDAVEAVRETLLELNKNNECHATILIYHQGGWGADGEAFIRQNPDEELTLMLNSLDPQIRLLITGHTRSAYTWRLGDLSVVQSEGNGINFSRCSVLFNILYQALAHIECSLLPAYTPYHHEAADNRWYLNSLPLPEFSIHSRARRVGTVVHNAYTKSRELDPVTTLGYLSMPWLRPTGAEETYLGLHAADGVLDAAKKWLQTQEKFADAEVISLINDGAFRAHWSPLENQLLNSHVWRSLPFEDNIALIEVSENELEQILEDQWTVMRPQSRFAHFQIAGFTYEFDSRRSSGQRIVRGSIRLRTDSDDPGKLMGDRKVFLAMPDYLAVGGDAYPTIAELVKARQYKDTKISVYTAVVDYTAQIADDAGEIPAVDKERSFDISAWYPPGAISFVVSPNRLLRNPHQVVGITFTLQIAVSAIIHGPFLVRFFHRSKEGLLETSQVALSVPSMQGPTSYDFTHIFRIQDNSSQLEGHVRSLLFDNNPFPEGLRATVEIIQPSSSVAHLVVPLGILASFLHL